MLANAIISSYRPRSILTSSDAAKHNAKIRPEFEKVTQGSSNSLSLAEGARNP